MAHKRIVRRASVRAQRVGHADHELLKAILNDERLTESWAPIAMEASTLVEDTGDGYEPGRGEIEAFAGRHR